MFTVAWTEPVETVGERKTRKDKRANKLSQASSTISSKSIDDSTSPTQARPPLFGIFGRNKGSPKHFGSNSKQVASQSETTIKLSKCVSAYINTSESWNMETSGAKVATSTPPKGSSEDGRQSNAETDHSSPSDESVFSTWNARSSSTTNSSWGSNFSRQKYEAVQPLSRDSYITQATVVRISSVGTMPIKINNPPSHHDLSPATSTFDFPIPTDNSTEKSSVLPRRKESLKRDVVLRSKEPPSGSWRPPEVWQCQSVEVEEAMTPLSKPLRRIKERKSLPRPPELSYLQNNIRKMNAASPTIILERLREEWVGIADSSIYRELELEKQLWMLAALKILGADNMSARSNGWIIQASALASKKVLSLYENKASSSFLSASNPSIQIHHLSTSPLLRKDYPNVCPLSIPRPSAKLPYVSDIFTSIHAFSLPALLPTSSIPSLLRECQRALISPNKQASPSISPTSTIFPIVPDAGALHLTILDPAPTPSTLGPLLRSWLDTHLIVNLERQFCCVNPARVFPIWLADAGLQAEGSTISNVRFLASVTHDLDAFSMIDGARQKQGIVGAECIKQELKSKVGRMLWKEMWGAFVEGEKWWWEDERVIEECERVGTYWEYALVKAVKEG